MQSTFEKLDNVFIVCLVLIMLSNSFLIKFLVKQI